MSSSIVVSSFLFILLWLLFSYLSIFYFYDILRRKAKTVSETDCIRRLWVPRKNPLLTREEIRILRAIDRHAFRGFQTARLIAVGGGVIWAAIMILRMLS